MGSAKAVQQGGVGLHNGTLLLTAILGILRRSLRANITESIARAEQLARAQRIDSLGRLAAGAAPHFNGLLGTILMSVDMAREGRVTEVRDEALMLIEQTVRQSRELTQCLLQLGRGDVSTSKGTFDLRHAVIDASVAARPLYGAMVPPALELGERAVPIAGSLLEIRQVVTSLLMNARDAVNGTGQVSLSLTLEGSSGGMWDRDDRRAPMV